MGAGRLIRRTFRRRSNDVDRQQMEGALDKLRRIFR